MVILFESDYKTANQGRDQCTCMIVTCMYLADQTIIYDTIILLHTHLYGYHYLQLYHYQLLVITLLKLHAYYREQYIVVFTYQLTSIVVWPII